MPAPFRRPRFFKRASVETGDGEHSRLRQRLRQAEAENGRLQQTLIAVQESAHAARDDKVRLERELSLARAQLAGEPDALPPEHLQVRQVAGVWGPAFFAEGRVIFDQLADCFRQAGGPLEGAATILDFGCGCGRVLWSFRHFDHVGEVWGCDVDREAIAWNRRHLAGIGRFCRNQPLPPTPFPSGSFAAIYAVSVFTHLPEDIQYVRLAELRRLLCPGGILVASLHGKRYWTADPGVKAEVEARGFAYRTGPATPGLPDYYMVAFHSKAYLYRCWSRFFDVVSLREEYIHRLHDAAILRRRND